ncbi:pilus assembly protein TadD [Solidesulfovibrio sp.]
MNSIRRHLKTWRNWPVIILFGVLAVLWCRWPIVALDFDLWYHLTGGAYILEHFRLPDGPFFSYIPAGDSWLDYYWLFQVLVYGVFEAGGYGALSVLRAALYLATVWCVYRFLRDGETEQTPSWHLLPLAITCAYALALQPRDLILRPHAFTYFYVVFLHYVVNRRPGLAWWLPVLTIVWVNLHGVEYPVILLVFGAYLAEYFTFRLLRRPDAGGIEAIRWPVIVSLYAVLATPAGLGLLSKPFAGPPFHELAVIELARQPWEKFLALFFYPDGRLVETAGNLLVLAAIAGAGWLAVLRRLRISRLVLLAGGLVLLPMMQRFTYEFLVLALPVLADAAALLAKRAVRPWRPWAAGAVSAGLVGLTLATTSLYMGNRPSYPVDQARLPAGVCNFLMQEGPGGRIYNVPNPGGYLQWRLHPKYAIGMDMETMLFSTADLYASTTAFADAAVLGRMLARYDPAFLLVPVADGAAKKTIAAFPRFAPVFFDDVLALYADGDKHPGLVARFRLETLDHIGWQAEDFEAMDAARRAKIAAECARLLDIYPQGLTGNTIRAKLLLAGGEPQGAAVHAEVLIREYPDRYMGYALMALAAFREQRYDEALALNRQALARALPVEAEMVWRNMYACFVRLRQFDKAYETLLAVRNPMSGATTAKDLFDLSMAAVASGREREGRVLLELAGLKTPETDTARLAEIEEMRRLLQPAGSSPDPGQQSQLGLPVSSALQ